MLTMVIPAISEIFLMLMSGILLILGTISNRKNNISYVLINITMPISIILTLYSISLPEALYFNGEFSHGFSTVFLKVILLFFGWLIFIYTYRQVESDIVVEFYTLALFSIIGMMVMISSASFLTLFLGIELMSLPIYALVALNKTSDKSLEAGIKYFIMGSVASGIMLYGISLLYGISGSISFLDIQDALKSLLWDKSGNFAYMLALLFILTAIGFKFAVVPYHSWVPDVYEGASLRATIFLSSIPKLAVFAVTIKILIEVFPIIVEIWQTWILTVGILSIVLGNLAALVQNNIKRLLGYSAISHIGYILLGLGATTVEGYSAALFYLVSYLLMTIGVFAILILLDNNNQINDIKSIQGLNQRDPVLAGALLLVLFSMAGVPPLVGFLGKLFVLKALFTIGYVKIVILALLMSVIGVFYYIRLIRIMYFEAPLHTDHIIVDPSLRVLAVFHSIVLLLLGIAPMTLMQYCLIVF
jgi:NADH-quinone oxidoreductase subunit N